MNDLKWIKHVFIACLFTLISASPTYASPTINVGIILSREILPYLDAVNGIKEALGQSHDSVRYFEWSLDGQISNAEGIRKDVKDKSLDLVFVVGSEALTSLPLKDLSVPVVSAMTYDDTSSPESDAYGAFLRVPFQKRFEIVQNLGFQKKRFGILYLDPKREVVIEDAKQSAEALGLTVVAERIESLRDFKHALEVLNRECDYLVMILDKLIYNEGTEKELILFSARTHLPIISFSKNYVKAGALLSISADFFENGKQAGRLGAMILDKEPISHHQVYAAKVELAWNRKIADVFGFHLDKDKSDLIQNFY